MPLIKLISLWLCLAVAPIQLVLAQSPDKVAVAPKMETMVLRATLNTVDKGDVFVHRTSEGDFLVKTENLKAMGFKEPIGPVITVDDEPHSALRSLPGVSFVFDDRLLALNITAEAQLLTDTSLDLRGRRRARGITPRDNSVFFNYALDYAGSNATAGGKVDFTGETGWRFGDYLFMTNATTQAANGTHQLTRLMSSVTHDDRERLLRVVAGDFFTPSRGFGNSVNLGGISIGKLYSLDPYYVQNPMQNIRGSVATPSQLELYVDGQRIRSEQIQPGGFELRDILAYGGASSAQVVLRDAFGRVQQFDYSFYFSDQPLAEGLHDYSYSLGALRENYGVESNRYGAAAFSALHRYGVSNALTLGAFAEGTRGLLNAGPSATLVLGSAGVLSLTLGASSFEGLRGHAASVGYNYQSRRWSLGFLLRRDNGSYTTLGNPVVISNRKYDGTFSASYNLAGAGSISLSHSAMATNAGPATAPLTQGQLVTTTTSLNSRVTALTYSVPLVSGKAFLTTRLSHIRQDQARRNEAFVGLTYYFENNYSATANLRKDQTGGSEFFQFAKNQPVGEGLGFLVSGDHSDSTGSQAQSTVQYNAPAAVLRGNYVTSNSQGQSTRNLRLSLAGGVAYVGGVVGFGRPVTDSFGIVKVDNLAGVDVSVNGQAMGKTDSRGTLFLPTLSAYYDSDVSISAESVPMEYSVPVTKLKISPSLRSGTVIDFGVTKLQAFTGILKGVRQGQSKPLEFFEIALTVEGKPVKLPTGRSGEFYVEHLKPGTYPASVQVEDRPCQFDLKVPESKETFVELGEFVCRPSP